ncbi:hypothetical protein C9374_000695 [Naegleria lovaniensis]|uniref:Uncharacterized protein n=1 Tax=Naegleria lovaniensis TaxID=51637 RepID=A0AA88GU97_NAELO|nr:uncharacterized protein C9374_000695 [Naegleria lovaniensis]KAG2388531.1 hypothetical protein C9374_000695 [Naegleria lovaniensis]
MRIRHYIVCSAVLLLAALIGAVYCSDSLCAGVSCGSHGSCYVDPDSNSPQCLCSFGYSGDACETAPPSCTQFCGHHTHCEYNEPGDVICSCSDGWGGEHCSEPGLWFLSENGGSTCNATCSNHGFCYFDNYGNEACNCTTGYSGKDCSTRDCSLNCGAHGTCSFDSQNSPICLCIDGYTTTDPSNPCASCSGSGKIVDPATKACICDPLAGYISEGSSCMCNKAAGFVESTNGTCQCPSGMTNVKGACVRICPPNWSGDKCEQYKPPAACVTVPSGVLSQCSGIVNYAVLNTDYVGSQTFSSVDKYIEALKTSIKARDSIINETANSYMPKFPTCNSTCLPAMIRVACYVSFKSCIVQNMVPQTQPLCLDACKAIGTQELHMDASSQCALISSQTPTCFYGPYLPSNTTCNGIAHSNSAVCSGRGKCIGQNLCSCPTGVVGSDCQYYECFGKNETDTGVCNGNGKCGGPNNCQCNDKFTGMQCDVPMCNGRSQVEGGCSFRGTCGSDNVCKCNNNYDGPSCRACKAGYTGIFCEVPICSGIPASDPSVCGGRGKCIGPNTCSCISGYNGTSCQTFACNGVDRLDANVCSGKGKCVSPNVCVCSGNYAASSYCSSCTKDYDGDKCTNQICNAATTCSGHGVCNALACSCTGNWEGKYCDRCKAGYTGSDCQYQCTASKCNNRGSCNDTGGCTCNAHTTGSYCESCESGWYGAKCDFKVMDAFSFSTMGDVITGTVYSSIKAPIGCADLVKSSSLASLGKGATCLLDSSRNEFQIILGAGATIGIGSTLTLGLYPKSGDSETVTVTVTRGSYQAIAPSAVLVADKYLVTKGCGKIYLDASASSSLDRRKLNFAWSAIVTPTTDDQSTLDSIIASQASLSRIVIDSTSLSVGTYTMQVVVASTFTSDSIATQTISFEVTEASVPTLSVREGIASSVTIGKLSVITPMVTIPNKACYKGSGAVSYSFKIDSSKTSTTFDVVQENGLLVFGPRRTVLPAAGDYFFTVTASQSGAQNVTLPFKVTAAALPLKVSFTVGDFAQAKDKPVTLAVKRLDPSNPSSTDGTVSVSCVNLDTSNACSGFPQDISSTLSLSVASMDPALYRFTATYSKSDGRSSSASVKVNVLDQTSSTVLKATIVPQEGVDLSVVDSSKTLILGLKLLDRQILTNKKVVTWSSADLDFVSASIATDKNILQIPGSLLSPGASYTVTVTVTDTVVVGGETITKTGSSDVTFTVNSPPTVGVLDVSPSTGVALVDDFKIACENGWTDPQLPLTYEFRTRLDSETTWNIISQRSTTNSISTKLGKVGTMYVKAVVYDALGAASELETTVTVTRPSTEATLNAIASFADQTSATLSDSSAVLEMIGSVDLNSITDPAQKAKVTAAAENTITNFLTATTKEEAITSQSEQTTTATISLISAATKSIDKISDNTVSLVGNVLYASTKGVADSSTININSDQVESSRKSADSVYNRVSTNVASRMTRAFTKTDLANVKGVYDNLALVQVKTNVADMPATVVTGADSSVSYLRKVSLSTLNALAANVSGLNSFTLASDIASSNALSSLEEVNVKVKVYPSSVTQAATKAIELSITSTSNSAVAISGTSSVASLSLARLNSRAASALVCQKWDGTSFVKDTTCAVSASSTSVTLDVKSTGVYVVATETTPVSSPKTSTSKQVSSASSWTMSVLAVVVMFVSALMM